MHKRLLWSWSTLCRPDVVDRFLANGWTVVVRDDLACTGNKTQGWQIPHDAKWIKIDGQHVRQEVQVW